MICSECGYNPVCDLLFIIGYAVLGFGMGIIVGVLI